MSSVTRYRNPISDMSLAAVSVAVVFAAMLLVPRGAQAQTYTVVHSFTNQSDGGNPEQAGVTPDAYGNLYGTNTTAGANNEGVVFKLSQHDSNWTMNPLYNFTSNGSGAPNSYGGVIRDSQGRLYGATVQGGSSDAGTIFELQVGPNIPASIDQAWGEATLYSFPGTGSDGAEPFDALTFDTAGNLYGTTVDGGQYYDGTLFELSPSSNGWTETLLHSFGIGGGDGYYPYSGVVVDRAGNVYGTTPFGGAYGCGVVFEFTHSGSGWTESFPYSFRGNGDGCNPAAGVVLDQAGNLYGATAYTNSGNEGYGTVFELTPASGGWIYNLLYTFSSGSQGRCQAAPQASSGPSGSMAMDSGGNLYGATAGDGAYGYGNVFKLTPSNGGWTYTSLHDFTNGSDGGTPCGWLSVDANGDVFGTTRYGGANNVGTVWEVTP